MGNDKALAQELSHPHSRAAVLTYTTGIHQLLRDEQAIHKLSKELIAFSTEQQFPLWTAWGAIFQGWGLAQQGQGEKGIIQMLQGMAAYRATGAEAFRTYAQVMLAEVYGRSGQTREGLSLIVEALATADKTGERAWEAEMYRLKGELTLQSIAKGSKSKIQAEAEECFQKAIDVARKQKAKSWELRAAMSLARLWQQQKKKDEARQLLAEVYNWFTEGFDTADLKDAQALLSELS